MGWSCSVRWRIVSLIKSSPNKSRSVVVVQMWNSITPAGIKQGLIMHAYTKNKSGHRPRNKACSCLSIAGTLNEITSWFMNSRGLSCRKWRQRLQIVGYSRTRHADRGGSTNVLEHSPYEMFTKGFLWLLKILLLIWERVQNEIFRSATK